MKTETMLPAMRLIGWCKNIDRRCAEQFPDIFRPSLMQALVRRGLLRPYTENYGWRLTAEGYHWLALHGYPMRPDKHTQRAKRRFDNAAVAVTMYAAGISPFLDGVPAFCAQGGYLPAFILRAQEGQHVLNSNQVVGFLQRNGVLLSVHYPHPDRRIVPQQEYNCTERMMLRAGCTDMGYLFCGQSYASIYRSLVGTAEENSKKVSRDYASLLRECRYAYLLPCDMVGAEQLRLLCIPDFRAQLAPTLGSAADQMAALDMPDCDFWDAHYQLPACITLDMDLCRVSQAACEAMAAGYNGLVLAALQAQRPFLEQIYPPPFYNISVIPAASIAGLKEGGSNAPSV